jgi:nucleotide-binding universal stress UspA family protein
MTVLAAVGGERRLDRIVETASELAEGFGDDLVVLHVMSRDDFEEAREQGITERFAVGGLGEEGGVAYVTTGRDVSSYSIEDAERDAAGVARTVVEETLDEERAADVETAGRVGDPDQEILEEGERRDARYIVVGGRKRSPVGKAVFGSTSQSIILNADRPVVSITEPDE